MHQKQTSNIKKISKILIRITGIIVILLLLLMLVLSIPSVQTYLGKTATNFVNKEFGTNIIVKKIDLSLLGSVQLKKIEIRDHHKDTLIFVNNLRTSLLNAKRIMNNEVNLSDASLTGIHFQMKTYKGENDDNMSIFLERFEDGQPKDSTSKSFVLKTNNIYFEDLTYKLIDKNKKPSLQFSAEKAGGNLQDFELVGPNFSMKIRNLHLTENRGVTVTNLSTNFSYTRTKMKLLKTTLETKKGSKITGNVVFNYKREDFSKFTDKVKIKANFGKSKVTVKDLAKFYNELSGNDKIFFSGKLNGTLNNFSARKFNIYSSSGIKFKGNMGFLNSFKTERGFVFDADINKLSANYNQLKKVLPNVLGKTMPTEFKKLGDFSLSGLIKVTPEQIDATLNVNSEIGSSISDLQIANIDDIDNAEYNGEVEFINFDLGKIANDSLIGKVSLKADINGKGFKPDNINTTIIGKVYKLNFKNYDYKDLTVNGQFQNKKFDGFLMAKDENFNLKFKGLADFSTITNKFDFTADVKKIDLRKTNLFTRDSISELSGKIKLDVSGNKIDDMVGEAHFKNVIYTNQKQQYNFKEFNVFSSVKDSVQTIKIDSKDIVKGELKGKFIFSELLPLTQNALWSTYVNYKPIPITTPNQFLNFDFVIYNQIVDVFLPQISVGKNTSIKGKIDGNKNSVKLTFSSPKMDVYNNIIDEIKLRVDNKNKLYNTHLTANKIANKYYDINKLNLINRTKNDTLFFKSTFKGGKKQTENFNLDFFYTLNKDEKSVVGIQKSTFNYNKFDWIINPKNNKNNKVTFGITDKSFNFSPFSIVSNDQKIEFSGTLLGNKNKDLKAEFTNVKLASFLPKIEKLALQGLLNGKVKLLQEGSSIRPLANIKVNELVVNEFSQGTLTAKIEGENSLDKYKVDIAVRDYNFDNVNIFGGLDFSTKKPTMDLIANFRDYELNGFSNFGGETISNIRGLLSGRFTSKGEIQNPKFKGELILKDAGLTIPYLNVDFDFVENARIKLQNQSFIMNNVVLQDTKEDTRGYLSGSITHQNFEQWYLNLDINTANLMVLDTKEAEDVPYYGRGFLRGSAKFRGLTNNLTIDVRGKTEKGTVFVIPLSDVTTIDNYRLIRFKSTKKKQKTQEIERITGLNLNINLEVTKDAVAQIVIDKVNKSQLKGSGSGNLDIQINTRGKFLMNGDLVLDNGEYDFRYGGIVNKKFTVQKGGTISWSGSPFDAELDLVALYRATANPSVLLERSFNRKIPVDLLVKITGGLFDSKQEFDIQIPNADSTIASELEFTLQNDSNTKLLNFFTLLSGNTFSSEETSGNLASNVATSTASDLLSNVLSSLINSKDGKFRLGLGYRQGEVNNINGINNDDQVDVSVSSQLSDRVIVNGKVGVPVGANTQTSVVGELNLEVLLNDEGTLRWTIFNKPNDIQYSNLEEGYTQGTGLSYQVNFNNLKELAEKIGLRKKKKEKNDTIVKKKKEFINFTPTKKDTTITKNERKQKT